MKTGGTVLIVEDDRAICNFLAVILESNGYKALVAETGKAALSMASSHCPQLMLLDLGLPDMDGLDVLEAVRAWTSMPVIVVSAQGHEAQKVAALDKGADDYVTKPFGNAELLARIRSVLRRPTLIQMEMSTGIVRVGGLSVDAQRHAVTVDGREVHLTPIEYRIVHMLASGAGRVFTHERMLKALWGPHCDDPQILRVNMANIRRKIEKNPADPQYILTEIGVGYRMVDAEEAGSG